MASAGSRPRRPAGRKHPGSEDKQSGSSEPEFLIVGRIARPHGVRGEVGMKLMTEHPGHLLGVRTLYVGERRQPLPVQRMRRHQQGMIIQFTGVTDRDMAEDLRDEVVYVHLSDAVPLEDGEYYLFQIEGIRVVTDSDEELGRLTDVLETGANDVYVITTPEGREILIPAIPEVICKVDVQGQVMVVHLLEGLR